MADPKNRAEVVTVDFDDTLKMTEDGNPNPIVIQKINKLRNKADKIYIVTSRRDSWDNKLEINDFVEKNNLHIDGIHLTNFADKWYTLEKLGSDMHFDDDKDEWETIADNLPDVEVIKIDNQTGKVIKDLGETIVKSSGEHCLKSKKGKNLGCYSSRSGAEKREKQVNYFKHKDK